MQRLRDFFSQLWADFKEGLKWMNFIEMYDHNLGESFRKREETKTKGVRIGLLFFKLTAPNTSCPPLPPPKLIDVIEATLVDPPCTF